MKKKGFTLIELLVVIAIIAMLLAILMPALGRVKKMAQRLVCGTNLKGLGNALNVYAFDYRDEFPIAGGKGNNTWGLTTDGPGGTGSDPAWMDPGYNWAGDDTVSIGASLFMLVREADVGPKSFVCKSGGEQPFKNCFNDDIVDLWDFGGLLDPDLQTPNKCVSYSYQLPYLTSSSGSEVHPADGTSSPANGILADRNPWFNTPALTDGGTAPTSIDADSFIDVACIILFESTVPHEVEVGNSAAHDREGQNVLFGDNHVDFAKRPDIATRYDNIYNKKLANDIQRVHDAEARHKYVFFMSPSITPGEQESKYDDVKVVAFGPSRGGI